MLNVVALVGRLTADPELRQTPQGTSVATFSLAVQRNFASKGTERQTDFINIVAWRQTAEFVTKYFKKGQLMAVDGSIQTRSYQDKETGKNRTAFEVLANNISFVESKNSQGGSNNAGYSAPAGYEQQAPANYTSGNVDDFSVIDDNEDLPF